MDYTQPFTCPPNAKVKEVWDATLSRIGAIETTGKWAPALADKVEHFKEKVGMRD